MPVSQFIVTLEDIQRQQNRERADSIVAMQNAYHATEVDLRHILHGLRYGN